ncbi:MULTISPECIES: S8 family serine peptidase [Streptomyces]|uniref:S8 family serine peptidase n=1 Tax=Streptomyces TaxID=1883 RepID=UPI001E521324|nr:MULTISPECIES: S8 family serine peptidase [Streptomyces]UFQ18409.1 S8 family serine peptidase [Streptomyces huasconensis]WCL88022.1 S8 family serine peptidase [Streptomyces sp. JCM 35825]
MKAGFGQVGSGWVPLAGPGQRRFSRVATVAGLLTLLAVGAAPGVAADDVQSKQWYLSAMKADEVWKSSTGVGVKIAVIDTGVSRTPSLKGRVESGKDFSGVSGGPLDDYDGHGTTMAELIVGTGRGGLKGLAPGAEVISFRIGLGKRFDDKPDRVPAAIRAAADSDAQIISMSFTSEYMSPTEKKAVQYARSKGKLLFAGVGNDAEKKNYIGYPAAYADVTGVSAAGKTGKVAKYSEFGAFVDLAAPGLGIPHWCDATFRSYCQEGGGGTSSATAIASASAALVWSKHPKWTANQVLRVLIDTAGRDWPKDEPSDYLGYGLIRPARNVVKGEGKPGPADIDPLTNKKTAVAGSDEDGTAPSASASAPAPPAQKATSGEQQATAAKSSDGDGSSRMWLIGGGLAAVAVFCGGGYAAVRARRGA